MRLGKGFWTEVYPANQSVFPVDGLGNPAVTLATLQKWFIILGTWNPLNPYLINGAHIDGSKLFPDPVSPETRNPLSESVTDPRENMLLANRGRVYRGGTVWRSWNGSAAFPRTSMGVCGGLNLFEDPADGGSGLAINIGFPNEEYPTQRAANARLVNLLNATGTFGTFAGEHRDERWASGFSSADPTFKHRIYTTDGKKFKLEQNGTDNGLFLFGYRRGMSYAADQLSDVCSSAEGERVVWDVSSKPGVNIGHGEYGNSHDDFIHFAVLMDCNFRRADVDAGRVGSANLSGDYAFGSPLLRWRLHDDPDKIFNAWHDPTEFIEGENLFTVCAGLPSGTPDVNLPGYGSGWWASRSNIITESNYNPFTSGDIAFPSDKILVCFTLMPSSLGSVQIGTGTGDRRYVGLEIVDPANPTGHLQFSHPILDDGVVYPNNVQEGVTRGIVPATVRTRRPLRSIDFTTEYVSESEMWQWQNYFHPMSQTNQWNVDSGYVSDVRRARRPLVLLDGIFNAARHWTASAGPGGAQEGYGGAQLLSEAIYGHMVGAEWTETQTDYARGRFSFVEIPRGE